MAALGAGDWIRGVVEPFAYLSSDALRLAPERRSALESATVAALSKHPGIARVFVSRMVTGPCPPPPDDSLETLVCRSLPSGSGELYIVPRAGSFFDPNLVRGRGINHGTPYLYDRTVPVLVRAPGRVRAGSEVAERLRPADFVATAAALLRITPPAPASAARDLSRGHGVAAGTPPRARWCSCRRLHPETDRKGGERKTRDSRRDFVAKRAWIRVVCGRTALSGQ